MVDREVNVRLRAQVSQYMSSMQQASARTAAMGTQVASTMRANKQAFTVAGAAAAGFGAAVGAGLASAVSAGAEFEAQMNQVRAVSGATGAEFEQLTGIAKELGASTKFSATEAAGGLNFLSMAGFEAEESIAALPGVLDLAAAGNMELAQAADISSNVLQGFSMEAENITRVNDTMAATFTSANTDMRQLGDAMSYVAPVANSAGIEMEETSAAIGLMSDAGIQGTRAGTGLRMALSRLLDETGPAADVLDRLGVSAMDSEGDLRDLDEIIRQLEESGANTSDVIQLFGMRAGPAMQTLVDRGGDALEDFTEELENSGGTAQRVADTQMEGLQGALTELGSALEGLKIKIAESGLMGMFEGLTDDVTGFVRTVEDLPDPVIKAGTAVAGLASVAGVTGGAFLILAPRVLELTDRFFGAERSAQAFRTTMRGFTKGALGVVALGALSAALDAVQSKLIDLERGEQDMSGFLGDLQEFAETGQMAGGMARTFQRDMDDLAASLENVAKMSGFTSTLAQAVPFLEDPGVQRNREEVEALDDALTELFEQDPDLGGQAWEQLVAQMREAGLTSEQIADALPKTSEEIAVAAQQARLAAIDWEKAVEQGDNLGHAMIGAGDAAQKQIGPTREAADALDEQGDAAEGAAADLDAVSGSWERLSGRQRNAVDALTEGIDEFDVYQQRLDERKEAEKEAADATFEAAQDTIRAQREAGTISSEVAQDRIDAARDARDAEVDALDDMGDSWDQFQAAQQQTLEEQREWMANLQTLRERGFDDLATDLAARGPEQAGIVAEAVEQSNEELRKGEDRALAIREQKAEAALAQIQSSGENMVATSGEISKETVDEIAEKLGILPGDVRDILADTDTVVEGQLKAVGETFGKGAEGAVRKMADKLNAGSEEVAGIVARYASLVARGIQPVMEGIGASREAQALQRFVAGDRITGLAAGGIADEPTILFGEGPGPEAFIPLYEGMGATHERSVGLWEDTGRRLGVYPDAQMAAGGFTSTGDVPSVPGMGDHGNMLGTSGSAAMERTREEAIRWLEENLAPELGAGIGYQAMYDALTQQFPGADLISGFRPGAVTSTGNRSYHAMGRAIDFDPSRAMAEWVNDNYFGETRELITPWQSLNIRNGSRFSYSDGVMELHDGRVGVRHNHWAMARGGILPAGIFDDGGMLASGAAAINTSGSPEAILPSGSLDSMVTHLASIDDSTAGLRERIERWNDLPDEVRLGRGIPADLERAAREAGKTIFEDLSIGGFDSPSTASNRPPRSSSFGPPFDDVGGPGDAFHVPGVGDFLRVGEDWFEATGPGQLAGMEELFGATRSASLANIGPLEGTVKDLFGGAGGIEEAVANLREWELAQMDATDRLAEMRDQLDDMVPFTDEYMAQLDAIERLEGEIASKRQQRIDDLQRQADEAVDSLRDMLQERDRIEQRMADRRSQFEERVAGLREDHTEQVQQAEARRDEQIAQARERHDETVTQARERHDESVAQARERRHEQVTQAEERRDEQVAQARERREEQIADARGRHHERVADEIERRAESLRFDPLQQLDFTFGNRPGSIADNVRSQIEAVTRSEDLLSGLRDQGLDDAVISALGLDDPRQLRTLEEFSRASEDEIARLNDAILDRNATASERAERDSERTFTALGSTLAGMRSELDDEMAQIHADTTERIAQADAEMRTSIAEAETAMRERMAEADTAMRESIAEADKQMRERMAEARESFGERLAEADAKLKENLTARREQFNADMAELKDDLQSIGEETGRTAVEAIADGINAGLPALREAARDAERQLERVQGVKSASRAAVEDMADRGVELTGSEKELLSFQHGGMVPGTGPQRIVAHGGERIVSNADNDRLIKAIESIRSGRGGPVQHVDEQHFHDAVDLQAWERSLVQAARITG